MFYKFIKILIIGGIVGVLTLVEYVIYKILKRKTKDTPYTETFVDDFFIKGLGIIAIIAILLWHLIDA